MQTETIERYRKARTEHWPFGPTPAAQAIRIARAEGYTGPWEDDELHADLQASWEQEGFRLVAQVEYDTGEGFPDYLGTIYHRERDIPWADRGKARRIEYMSRVFQGNHGTVWLVPMEGYAEQMAYYRTKSKVGKAAAHLRAARSEAQTVERARAWLEDEWTFIGIRVYAIRAGVRLGEGSLWAVESDGGRDYFNEVTRAAAAEALDEARAALASLCGGKGGDDA